MNLVLSHLLLVTVTSIEKSMQYLLVVFHGKVHPSHMTAPDPSHLMALKYQNGWRMNMKYGLGTCGYFSRICWQITTSMVPSTMHHFGNTIIWVVVDMNT